MREARPQRWQPKAWTPQAALDFALHHGKGHIAFTLQPGANVKGAQRLAAWAIARALGAHGR